MLILIVILSGGSEIVVIVRNLILLSRYCLDFAFLVCFAQAASFVVYWKAIIEQFRFAITPRFSGR